MDQKESKFLVFCVTFGIVVVLVAFMALCWRGCERAHVRWIECDRMNHERNLEQIRSGMVQVYGGWVRSEGVKP